MATSALKAARKLGISEIPVILCDEWTPAQVKAFRLMVNRSVSWASWDEDLLARRTMAERIVRARALLMEREGRLKVVGHEDNRPPTAEA